MNVRKIKKIKKIYKEHLKQNHSLSLNTKSLVGIVSCCEQKYPFALRTLKATDSNSLGDHKSRVSKSEIA